MMVMALPYGEKVEVYHELSIWQIICNDSGTVRVNDRELPGVGRYKVEYLAGQGEVRHWTLEVDKGRGTRVRIAIDAGPEIRIGHRSKAVCS